jgi:hypothetical protein
MLEHALCSAAGQMTVLITDISVVLPVRVGVWHVPEPRLTKFADNHDPNRPSPNWAGVSILAGKNPAKTDLFRQIVPFRRSAIEAPGNIDENWSLPYKPRQLSAMIRFDRSGSIWAGNGLLLACQHRRTYLNIRQVVSLTGNRLSAENDP